MPKEVMRRQAADNEYLHKDFHGAMSCGIQYLQDTYGPEAVIEYLQRFTDAYHSPLKQKLIEQGLPALAEYTRGIYELEGGDIEIDLNEDEMLLRIAAAWVITVPASALMAAVLSIVRHRAATSRFRGLGGVARRLPVATGGLILGGLALGGFPLTAGFPTRWAISRAVWNCSSAP